MLLDFNMDFVHFLAIFGSGNWPHNIRHSNGQNALSDRRRWNSLIMTLSHNMIVSQLIRTVGNCNKACLLSCSRGRGVVWNSWEQLPARPKYSSSSRLWGNTLAPPSLSFLCELWYSCHFSLPPCPQLTKKKFHSRRLIYYLCVKCSCTVFQRSLYCTFEL